MARARKYPKANTTAQWWEEDFPRVTMDPVSKLLLHSTETSGWPGYSSGASAPTITYNPWVAAGERWRQHCYIDRSARALRDPSGTAVRENQDGVVQVEIIGYCDPALARKYGHAISNLPDHAYEDIGHFLAFLHTEYAVPLVRAGEWDTYPPADSIRMSGPEYDRFRGMLGHQHASGNTHGDPGMTNAQVDRILAVAKRIVGGTTQPPTAPKPPVPEGDNMTDYSPDDIKSYAGLGVHGQMIGRSGVTIGQALDSTRKDAAASRAMLGSLNVQVAGLTAAVKALSEQQGVDPAAIVAAVQTATSEALADLKITLAVDDDDPATQEN